MTEKQQLDAELTAIFAHLPGWALDPKYAQHTWCAVLRDGTGKGIHVNATHVTGRLHIAGIWPFDGDGHECRPDQPLHISVARNRPPEKIAADLQRRFLSWYLAAYAEQEVKATRNNARRTRQQEATVELAALLGKEATRQMQSNPSKVYTPGLTVEVHDNGETASIELRYKSIKVVKAVLRALVKADGLTE